MSETFTKLISLIAYESSLPACPDDYYLRAKTRPKTLGLRDIADEVARRLGSNPDEVYAHLNAAESVVSDAVSSSYIVSTPTMHLRPCAKGTLVRSQLTQPLDPTRVSVYAAISMGPRLRQAMSACRLELFTQPALTGPHLTGAEAIARRADGTPCACAPQPGQPLRLIGRNLKLVGTSPAVGITFTSVADPSQTAFVPLSRVTINHPRQLLFLLPATVTDGLWTVQVATQYSTSRQPVPQPRISVLEEPIAVGTAYQDDASSPDAPTA